MLPSEVRSVHQKSEHKEKFYRAGSEVALFAVIASSSNGGPPLTFSVFRCIRRTALSFCFCSRANSFCRF